MALDRKIESVHTNVDQSYNQMNQQVKDTAQSLDILIKNIVTAKKSEKLHAFL